MGKMFSKFSNNCVRFSNDVSNYGASNNNNGANTNTSNNITRQEGKIIFTEDGTTIELASGLFNIIRIFF